MKALILEDDPNRMEWFDEHLEIEYVDSTDLAQEAIEYLKENVYDVIFLDHDLGGEQYVASSVFNTGFTVANMIHETVNKDTPVVIHSWNSQGAKMMKQTLTIHGVKNEYQPFCSLEFKMIVQSINQQAMNNEEKD